MKKSVFLLFLSLVLNACSLFPLPTSENYNQSFISVSAPGFQLKPGDVLSWQDPINVIFRDNDKFDTDVLKKLTQQLESALQTKGVAFVQQEEKARYLMEGFIILDNALTKEQLVEYFDLAPVQRNKDGLAADILIIRLIHPYTKRTLWCGAMEIFSHDTTDYRKKTQATQRAAIIVSRNLIP